MHQDTCGRFLALLASRPPYPKPSRYRYYFRQIFRGFDFPGKRVLDVGGGVGHLTFYAVACGAQFADCLEPEAAGSTRGVAQEFELLRRLSGCTGARLIVKTFQQYVLECGDQVKYDCIVCDAAINHLDEVAVTGLGNCGGSRDEYRRLLTNMRELLSPTGRIIISDSMRRNLFGDCGVKSPVCPTIEWEKHQDPSVWVGLFSECGFELARMEWRSFNLLGDWGRVVFGNAVFAYLYGSSFVLEFRRA